MTDRYNGFIITLAEDLREDEAEDTLTALRSIKGVAAVEPVPADGFAEWCADTRVRTDIGKKLIDMGVDMIRAKGSAERKDDE